MLNKGYNAFAGRWTQMILFPVLYFMPVALFPNENYSLGSRSAAMGNASVMISDLWSVHHNQAGLASLSSVQAGFHYDNKFLVQELGVHALALAMPARPGTIALSYTYFGFSQYNETKAGLAFGRMFGPGISAGIRINYLHTYIASDYGKSGYATVEGGIITRPAEGVFIGAHIYNPFRPRNVLCNGERMPLIFRGGIAVMVGDNVMTSLEIQHETNRRAVFRSGLEIGVQGPLFLRAGINSNPVQSSFGFGYVYGRLAADLAFTFHQLLGYSPHITVSYIL
jgi:hypothetical protein